MQSEGFDNRIREAAEHHHPAYDDHAWGKMEKLLDKHLPEEKEDNRKFIFLILLFLLLGGGAWFYLSRSGNGGQKTAVVNRGPETDPGVGSQRPSADGSAPVTITGNSVTPDEKGHVAGENSGEKNRDQKSPKISKVSNGITASRSPKERSTTSANLIGPKDNRWVTTKEKKANEPAAPDDKNSSLRGEENREKKNELVTTATVVGSKGNETPIAPDKTTREKQPVTANKTDVKMNDTAAIAKAGDEQKPAVKKDESKTKTNKRNRNSSFFISGSIGPDVSAVGNSIGKMKIVGGVGLGYTYKNRVTLRTGFYTARKIYSANPGHYNNPWTSAYSSLVKMTADCKVYEIPLSLSYNFGRKPDRQFFGSAGVSTYLMKRETYDYFYKSNATAATFSRQYTLDNINTNYFSVLTLSAGYQKDLNKTISISAEPYVKLPLIGIGYGGVNLNSAGILFTATVRPFQPKAKKK